jgi:hypothetical protein
MGYFIDEGSESRASRPMTSLHSMTNDLTHNRRKKPIVPKLKDPGVPSLPNLKVRSAEIQRRRSLCAAHRPSYFQLPLVDTPSTRGASPSQSPPHVGGRRGSAQARSRGKASRVRSQQNRYVCVSLIRTLRLSADRHYAGLRARARMRRHGSNTSATQPQRSPSDLQARISTPTSPLEPRLRCSASSRHANRARRRASPSASSASRL